MSLRLGSKELLTLFYSGTPQEQLERAEAITAWLHDNPALATPLQVMLPQIRQEADVLATQMQALNMGTACSACAAKSYGGCCSAYMAGNCDVALMVLNLLLGAELSLQMHGQDACCFLTATGCLFAVKPVFCLNYYCLHLQKSTAAEDMHKLQIQAARVLGLQTAFEEQLLAIVRLARQKPPSL